MLVLRNILITLFWAVYSNSSLGVKFFWKKQKKISLTLTFTSPVINYSSIIFLIILYTVYSIRHENVILLTHLSCFAAISTVQFIERHTFATFSAALISNLIIFSLAISMSMSVI